MARAKKEDTVEPLYDYSIAVPVTSAYKRKQVYGAMRGFSGCEIGSPDAGTLKIKFFGVTGSGCELRRAILASRVKHRRGNTPAVWTDERTPVKFRVGDCTFAVVSRNGEVSVELEDSTRVAHEGPQEGAPGVYFNRKLAEQVIGGNRAKKKPGDDIPFSVHTLPTTKKKP